jgi:hypothetical protein
MRSTDEGYTWSEESTIQTRTEGKNAIYTVQAADGRIMVFYGLYAGYPTNGDIYYQSSTDNGSTWTGEVALVADTGDQYLGSVVRSGTGRMYAFYCSSHYPTDTALNYVSSTDNGQTWSSPIRVLGWSGPAAGYNAATFDQNGDLWVAFTRWVVENGYNNADVFWTSSTNDGVTWSDPVRVTTYAGNDYVDDLLAVDGSPWVFIRSDRWMNLDIYYGPLYGLSDPNPPPYIVATATDPTGPRLRGSFAVQALCAAGTGIDSISMEYTVDGVRQPDVTLFDDGNHGDRGAGDGWYGNYVGPFSPGHNTRASRQYRVYPTGGVPFLTYPSSVDIYGVHDVGNVELNVAYWSGRDGEPLPPYNYPSMEWPAGSGVEYLWGGHTWVGVVLGSDTLVDCGYYVLSGGTDWYQVDGDTMTWARGVSHWDSRVRLDDRRADNPIGIELTKRGLSWFTPYLNDFVIQEYTYKNTGLHGDLSGVYIGFCYDFDVSRGDNQDDMADCDSTRSLSYMYDYNLVPSGNVGVRMLSHRARSHSQWSYGSTPGTPGAMFGYLASDSFMTRTASPADYATLQSVGPFGLAVGESLKVVVGLAVGDSLRGLIQTVDSMKALYDRAYVGLSEAAGGRIQVGQRLELAGACPTRQTVMLRYRTTSPGRVTLRVADAAGRVVSTLVDGNEAPGVHNVTWDGRDRRDHPLPTGVYFMTMNAGGVTLSLKVALSR